MSAFNIGNGSLSAIGTPMSTGQHPFGVALDPSGKFLFVANKMDSTISAFSVNTSTGALMPLSGSPFGAGGSAPAGIVIVPMQ